MSTARLYGWLLPAVLFVVSVARTAGMPGDYALGHWLHHYGYGFIKRGLPGTLLKPLVDHREGVEVRLLLGYLTVVLLVVSVGGLVRAIQQLLEKAPGRGAWLLAFGAAIAFAGSPFSRNLGYLIGYFDHLIVIATLLTLALVRAERWLLAGLVGAAALLSHELYLVVGLPAVALACWLKLEGVERGRWTALAKAVGLPVVVGLAIFAAAENLSTDALESLRAEIMRGAALGAVSVDATTVHLAEPLADSFAAQAHEGWERLFLAPVLESTLPSFVVLFAAAGALAYRFGGRIACVLALGAVIAPLGVHFVAYDHGRITGFALFGAFTAIYAAVVFAPRRVRSDPADVHPPDRHDPRDRGWDRLGIAFAVLGVVSVAWTWAGPVYPITRAVYDVGVFALRKAPVSGHPRCDRELFPNSDFETGTLENWVVTGEGWPAAPTRSEELANATSMEGAFVYTTAVARRGGAAAKPGRLSSHGFTIEGDNINFLLEGKGPLKSHRPRSVSLADGTETSVELWEVSEALLRAFTGIALLVDRGPS